MDRDTDEENFAITADDYALCDDGLFEQWKVCVESADRVSQRRDSSNGLFTTLCIGTLTASIAIGGQESIFLLVMGIVISVAWFLHILSFKKLNEAKFTVICSMEKRMETRPFTDEWNELSESKKYSNQTTIERILPVLFGIVFVVMIIMAIFTKG